MRLFAVRHHDDKQAVGFFWADSPSNIIFAVDEVTEVESCEFQEVVHPGAFIWDGPAPGLGVYRDWDDDSKGPAEIARLRAGIGIAGSLETYFYDDESGDNWNLLEDYIPTNMPERKEPRPKPAPKPAPKTLSIRMTDPNPTCNVYFIGCGDYIKIGMTMGPVQKRMKALSTAHHQELTLLAVIEGAEGTLEYELHNRFADLRGRGEWFKAEAELLAFIAEVNKK